MFKLIEPTEVLMNRKQMSEMEPCELCRLLGSNDIVMRTASVDKFEVMNISNPCQGACWTSSNVSLLVEKLPAGTKIILEAVK